ncbi:hypothetical protein CH289_07850 [Rhodococcus sp. RS1C4]|nr:hypothetical protein [Rhodococcus sp. RS1C4]OZC55095.1 hypothetical protein CH289_07850 [Rhodococcus sp. RS1C4]
MSIDTAEAYRLAARFLAQRPIAETPEGYDEAVESLRAEADDIDSIRTRNCHIGRDLKTFLATTGRDDSELGRKAWELVHADRKLHTPPSTESLAARDDIEN